jgi:hypothetical protein
MLYQLMSKSTLRTWGEVEAENPFKAINKWKKEKGIDELNENSSTLGAASFTHVRELTELIIENTDSRLLPQAGFFFLNNFYFFQTKK